MPKVPFTFSRETEYAAVDRAVRDERKRRILREMVDTVLLVREKGGIDRKDLEPIVAGMKETDEAVWGRAAGWLAKLHGFAPDLVSAILEELAKDRSANVRFHLCATLGRFQREIGLRFARRFMEDRSNLVRGTVPNMAVEAEYAELIPDFERAGTTETDADLRANLQQAIALLRGEDFKRDGWIVRKAKGGIEYMSEAEAHKPRE